MVRRLIVLAALLAGAVTLGPVGATAAAAAAAPACTEPTPAVRDAIRQSVMTWAVPKYPELIQDARVVRVCGDWAMAVLVPRERVNQAAVVLQVEGETWRVVAGPGTAFPPDARPSGSPPALYGDEPDGLPGAAMEPSNNQ